MKFINLTPHNVNIIRPDGSSLEILPSGTVARVDTREDDLGPIGGIPTISLPLLGQVAELPDPRPGTAYIVSLMVAQHPDVARREDVFAPATGPAHEVVRDEQGRIAAVTRLIRVAQPAEQDCNCGSGFPVSTCPDCRS